jgi:hypothetical protein
MFVFTHAQFQEDEFTISLPHLLFFMCLVSGGRIHNQQTGRAAGASFFVFLSLRNN